MAIPYIRQTANGCLAGHRSNHAEQHRFLSEKDVTVKLAEQTFGLSILWYLGKEDSFEY